MELFDCCVSMGLAARPPLAPCRSPEDLLGAMDRHGIARALVLHEAQRQESPLEANAIACEACAGRPRLEPVWAILPHQTGEFPPPAEVAGRMRESGVRCLWALPSAHRYCLSTETFGGLLELMAEVGMPLFVPLAEVGGGAEGFRQIARVLRDVPDLTLVGVGHGCWGDDRFFRPLLERYPGLHIDISRYELDAGIECLVARYGSGRLLFGSGHPYSTMGGSVTMLARAPIPDAARAGIASGNLDRLLGWGTSEAVESAPTPKSERIHLAAAAREVSPLVGAWMAGPPSDCPVVDVHGHFGPFSRIWFPTDDTAEMLRTMDRCGVRIVISSHHVALTSDPFRGNATLQADALEREPSRFLGYYTWNPHYAAEQERELAAFPPHDGFVGFKLHPSEHGVPLTDPRYAPLFEYANARRLPVLSHTWGGSAVDSPELVSEIATRCPDVPFLMGHSGYGAWDTAVRVALAHPNVHLELCAAYSVRGVIEKFVREVGSERVFYGTDLPWFDPMYVIGTILWAEISDDDRRNILYRNAARLFPAVAERLGRQGADATPESGTPRAGSG